MMSPKASPRLARRSITPTVNTNITGPPPLPPRKSSPTVEQHPNSLISQISHHRSVPPTPDNQPPPRPPHAAPPIEPNLAPSTHSHYIAEYLIEEDEASTSKIELSSPETIYGIIDTRYDINQLTTQESACPISSPSVPSHTRHRSCPQIPSSSTSLRPAVKSNTISTFRDNLNLIDNTDLTNISEEPPYENIKLELPLKPSEEVNDNNTKRKFLVNPLDDLSISNNSVSYANLNIDYIKQLVSEGYSKDEVIRALGITRNNIDMAGDILHEFATKNS